MADQFFWKLTTCLLALATLRAQGTITTVAGSGPFTFFDSSFGGDGGPATAAILNTPWGVAVDRAGNIYIADTKNHRIRKVDTAGVITTIAGTGESGLGGDGGAATAAKFSYPRSVALDTSGNLYIADTGNDRIRRVTPTGIITTLVSGALYVEYLRFDLAGNLLFVDADTVTFGHPGTYRIRKYTPQGVTSLVYTLPSTVQAVGITTDSDGNVYAASYESGILRIAPNGTVTPFSHPGAPTFPPDGSVVGFSSFSGPVGLAFDGGGNLFVAEVNTSRVRRVDAVTKIVSTVVGNGKAGITGDGGPPAQAQVSYPIDVAVDRAGNVYIADLYNHRIRKVTGVGVPFSNRVPAPVSVQASPSGVSNQYVLTLSYSDPDGTVDLTVVNALINFGLDGRNACYLAFDVPANVLYLVGNDGATLSGLDLNVPLGNSVSNSQCDIVNQGITVSRTSNLLTLTVPVTLHGAFAGNGQVVHMAARDSSGGNSGWIWKGAMVPQLPATTSTVPVALSASNSLTAFTIQYAGPSSFNLSPTQLLIANGLDGRAACYLGFDHINNSLFLVNDAGTDLLPGPIKLNSAISPPSLENSQCKISADGSTFVDSGSTLTLRLNIQLKSGFNGKVIYGAAQTTAGANSGWRVVGFVQ